MTRVTGKEKHADKKTESSTIKKYFFASNLELAEINVF